MQAFNPLSLRFYRSVLLFGCITFIIPLLLHAYLGTFMRLNGDEYCYLSVEREHGFWGMQWYSYLHIGGLYNGNRYSLNFMHAILGWLGPKLPAVAPALALSLLFIGSLFALRQAKKFFNGQYGWITLTFIALSSILFVLLITPDITQILYWYGGMSQYFIPLILNAFLIGLILLISRKRSNIGFLAIAITAFWSGGYSETPGLVQAVYLLIFLVLAIYLANQDKNERARNAIEPLLTALLASILALCLLAFAPSTAIRLSMRTHPMIPEVIITSIRHGLSFIIQAFKSFPLPYLIWLTIMMAIGYLNRHLSDHPQSYSLRRVIKHLFLVVFLWVLLTIVSMSPSVYAQFAYPGERALLSARYLSVIAVALVGWFVGSSLPMIRLPVYKGVSGVHIAILILLLCSLYPFRGVPRIMSNLPKYQKWAAFWDVRDEHIRNLKEQGQVDIEVVKLDHLIYDLGELSEDPDHWHNVCAAMYYGVHSIRANQPGWDE